MAQAQSVSSKSTQVNGVPESRIRRWLSSDNPWVWLSPAIVMLFLYSIFPLFYNIAISLQEWSTRQKLFIPKGLENWEKLFFTDARMGNALGVTLQYTFLALIIEMLLGLVIALIMDAKPWGSGVMQTLLILPMVTAPAVGGLMFRLLEHSEFGVISWIFYSLGLLVKEEPLLGGTGKFALWGVLIVDIWQWTPFFVLIILAGLKGVPEDIIEASQVDGANYWQRLTRIKIPLLFSVITIAVLFRLVDLYKIFDYIAIMTSGGPGGHTETISFYSYVNTFQLIKWGYGAAIGVFVMAMGWVSAFLYQRIFRVRW
ncbi:MAG: sugar ABC transporter permease [Anaerolineaceae bacterium]|nr:sugar ABC transporter permease [Anaerolineaceae bacterium]